MISLCYLALRWVLALATLHGRSDDFKELEIVVLRHELAIFRRAGRQPRATWTDRLLLAAASRLLTRTGWQSFIVTPKNSAGVASALGDEALDLSHVAGSPADRPENPSIGRVSRGIQFSPGVGIEHSPPRFAPATLRVP